jgi:ATP-dependent RNA helicase DeaD
MTVLRVSAGRDAGIRPGDLVGAIAGEAKIDSGDIGAIRIEEAHSLVEVPASLAERVIRALKATKLRGRKVDVVPTSPASASPSHSGRDRDSHAPRRGRSPA